LVYLGLLVIEALTSEYMLVQNMIQWGDGGCESGCRVSCPSLSHLVKFDYSSLRECSSMREGNMSLLNDGKTIKICWIFLIYHTWWNINLPVTCLSDFPIMYVIYSYADFGTLK
jgi:hypothetical protein